MRDAQPPVDYCCREHWYAIEAGLRFVELVMAEYDRDGDGVLAPQNVAWVTIRDADVGLAVGSYMAAIAAIAANLHHVGELGAAS